MKLAIFGDLHYFFNEKDVEYFNRSEFDYLIFTGDLPDFFHLTKKIYFTLGKLKKKSYLIWGNHDGFSFLEVVGELFKKELFQIKKKDFNKIERRLEKIKKILGENFLCGGYEIVLLDSHTGLFLVRPHSIGGKRISYKEYLKQKYNVDSFDTSIQKMKLILDEFLNKNPVKSLVFLGHNGPYGIGDKPYDLWGCDFAPHLGDFGDYDFQEIINYAKSLNIKIPLVIAGHMHHRLSKNSKLEKTQERNSIKQFNDTFYINPAKVPRIQKNVHYFISVVLNEKGIQEIKENFVKL